MSASSLTAISSFTDRAPLSPSYLNSKLSALADNISQLNSDLTTFGVTRTSSTLSYLVTDQIVVQSVDSGGFAWNAKAFGPLDPTGVTDSTSAFTQALSFACAYPGARVQIPAGQFLISSVLTITNRVTLEGNGMRGTILLPAASFSTYMIQVSDCWRNNGEEASGQTSVDLTKSKAGVFLRDFSIIGNYTNPANGIRTIDRSDWLTIENVGCYYLNGVAFEAGISGATNALIRESYFRNFQIRSCGSSNNSQPCMWISNGSIGGDGTNQLFFDNCIWLFNYGPALIESNSSNTGRTMRRFHFLNPWFHGKNTAADAPACDILRIAGDVQVVQMTNASFNGSTATAATPGGSIVTSACLRLLGNANSEKPFLCWIHADLRSCQGDGYVVERVGSLWINGTVAESGIVGSEFSTVGTSVVGQAYYNPVGSGTRSVQISSNDSGKVFGWFDKEWGLITSNASRVLPSICFASERSLGFYRSGLSTMALTYGQFQTGDGSATRPGLGFSSESSLGLYRSAASEIATSYGTWVPSQVSSTGTVKVPTLVASRVSSTVSVLATEVWASTVSGSHVAPAGTAVAPVYAFSSEASLGWYRSGTSTVAPSYGSVDFATNAVRVSIRTAASFDSTTLAVNEIAFSLHASGASLAIRSGGTIWYFASSMSTKG